MFTPTRITRSIAIALGAVAAAVSAYAPSAIAMPAGPVVGPVAHHSGPAQSATRSDAAQIQAAPAADRSDAAQRGPLEPTVGGRLVNVDNPKAAPSDDIKWTLAAVLGAVVLLASGLALTSRPQTRTAS
jgi:hypothetical protein